MTWRGRTCTILLGIFILSSVGAKLTSREIALTNEFVETTADLGDRLSVSCSNLLKQPAVEFTWFKDGSVLESAVPRLRVNNNWLKIRKVRREDKGYFSCMLRTENTTNWYNMSLTIREMVPGKPDHEKMIPESLSHKKETNEDYLPNELSDESPYFVNYEVMHSKVAVLKGHNYTLVCEADGNPEPDITWYKDEYQLSSVNWNMTVLVTASAIYTCIVKNIHGQINHTVQLLAYSNSKDLPIIVETPSNTTAISGDSISFTCKVSIPEAKIIWLRHNHIPPSQINPKDYNVGFVIKSKDQQKLVFSNSKPTDSGWYTCLVTKDNRTEMASAWLNVIRGFDDVEYSNNRKTVVGAFNPALKPMAPRFIKPDQMHRVVAKPAGNMVRLRCLAEGNPEPEVNWLKNGEVPTRQLGIIRKNQWSLILEDLVTTDSGNYTCNVCNSLGCINFTYKVEIQERFPHKPYIKENYPQNITALVYTNVSFLCSAISDLEPFFQWVKPMHYVEENEENINGTVIKQSGDDEEPEKLVLSNVTLEDEGWYTCIASNSLGHAHASAYLHVVTELEISPEKLQNSQPLLVNILIGILCTMFLLGVCIMMNVFRRLKREKLKKLLAIETARAAVVTQWTKKVVVEKQTLANAEEPLLMPLVKIEKQKTKNYKFDSMVSEYELPLDSSWEFPRDSLTLGKTLGEGAFGKVVRAEGEGILQQGISTVVAVKMLKEGHTDSEMMDLVSEMEMMKMIGKHRNIINLLGCCTQDGPLYVIVEFAPHGNLRDFLRQHRPSSGYEPAIGTNEKDRNTLSEKDLVSFAYQVARGMEYLASRRCIHRDLAARNVLVSNDYILKIADFGLARDVHSNDYYRKTTDGRLPVKWMAPEALFHRVYTTQSDVWSYGVLLWEIMTLGGTPYPSVPSVDKLYSLLQNGHRMERPRYCSLEIYLLMRECWSYQANERPIFSELVEDLDRILSSTSSEEYLDLGIPQLETPPSSSESSDDEETFPYLL
uniref:receptor protein-tyrosine kinase n=1 Tax=Clastoptera arizonana TaxID=38151 RepID=A0A1B6CPE6_9HEMI